MIRKEAIERIGPYLVEVTCMKDRVPVRSKNWRERRNLEIAKGIDYLSLVLTERR